MTTRHCLLQFAVCTLVVLSLLWPAGSPGAFAQSPPLSIIPADGMNLQIKDPFAAGRVGVRLQTPAHNWFAGTLTNLPLNEDVTIELAMAGNDTGVNKADVKKWTGFHPVMTYTDPNKYESYECFAKDEQGRWMSLDPFKADNAKFAGMDETPSQQVVPAEIAKRFLSADGKYWSPWCEVAGAEIDGTQNTLRMKQQFALPSATVAMRYPFTYSYLQLVLQQVRAAHLPGVKIDEIGETPGKRKIQVIRIEDPLSTSAQEQRTVLVMAREHATEPAGSWSVLGLLSALIETTPEASALRQNTNWLLVPILDPDGSAESTFDRLTLQFCPIPSEEYRPEILAYTRYLANYVYAGHTLDVAVTLHNVEATECANIYCPYIDAHLIPQVQAFNKSFFALLQQQGYAMPVPDKVNGSGNMPFRLYGWCARQYNTFDLAFEVNDRYPPHPLTLTQLQLSGKVLGQSLANWLLSDAGNTWHTRSLKYLSLKTLERDAYLQQAGYDPADRPPSDLLVRGF